MAAKSAVGGWKLDSVLPMEEAMNGSYLPPSLASHPDCEVEAWQPIYRWSK